MLKTETTKEITTPAISHLAQWRVSCI